MIQNVGHAYALDLATRSARELPAGQLGALPSGQLEIYHCAARSAAQLLCIDKLAGTLRTVDLTTGTAVSVK